MSTSGNSLIQINTVSEQLNLLLKGGYIYRLNRIPNSDHKKAYILAHRRVREVLEETADKDYRTVIERLFEFKVLVSIEAQNHWYRNSKPQQYWDMAFDDAVDAVKSLILRFVIGVNPETHTDITDFM